MMLCKNVTSVTSYHQVWWPLPPVALQWGYLFAWGWRGEMKAHWVGLNGKFKFEKLTAVMNCFSVSCLSTLPHPTFQRKKKNSQYQPSEPKNQTSSRNCPRSEEVGWRAERRKGERWEGLWKRLGERIRKYIHTYTVYIECIYFLILFVITFSAQESREKNINLKYCRTRTMTCCHLGFLHLC